MGKYSLERKIRATLLLYSRSSTCGKSENLKSFLSFSFLGSRGGAGADAKKVLLLTFFPNLVEVGYSIFSIHHL